MAEVVSRHWLVESLEEGLRRATSDQLQEAAAAHLTAKDETRTEGGGRNKRISPTLLSSECRLQVLKRYRGHTPQPGVKPIRNERQGRSDAGSAMNFLRGFLGEGMVVAALRAAFEEGPKDWTMFQSVEIMGVSPVLKFEYEGDAPYLAYPDVALIVDGQVELVQLKCPSVFAVQRYKRDGPQHVRRRYGPQAIGEMFIGRRMGLPIVRNHVLVYSFEGFLPQSEEAKSGYAVNALVETVDWEDGMERWVLSRTEEILEDDRAADQGVWVPAYPADNANKWPCSYCSHSRIAFEPGMTPCEENEKWEPKSPPPPPPTPSSAS